MSIAFTIPFWLILVLLVVVGIIGFCVIIDRAGDWDFVTPMIAIVWAAIFIVLAIGLALGKWVF
jgi:predicted tellurium resistance membrane protein TerC